MNTFPRSLLKPVAYLTDVVDRIWVKFINRPLYKSRLGYCGKNVDLRFNSNPGNLNNVYLYDNTNIYHGFKIISAGGRFIMKKNSSAAVGLTVITGNHQRVLGYLFKDLSGSHQVDIERDVVVEEDVWIGSNVTLLSGITIGRGATIGAGCLCMKNIPPYAVVMGNPAKVVGFCFNPNDIIEHEMKLYPESERLPLELLEKNYKKFYLNRTKDINDFIKI